MQISRWGNSLAVRIPSAVAEALDLREGDDVTIRVSDPKTFELSKNDSRRDALNRIKGSMVELPADWKIGRDELNAR